MSKKNIILSMLLIFFLFLAIHEYNSLNNLIKKNYEITFETNYQLLLEIDSLVSIDNFNNTLEEQQKINSLLEIIYNNSKEHTNYEIHTFTDFEYIYTLNYFEDYVYYMKSLLNTQILNNESIDKLDDIKSKIIQTRKLYMPESYLK
ncbi:MAG: hypothetical protein U9Q80_00755 [Bacillota bacterium]|nr:hypothetical protein [Bacillota bacterium]